MKYAKTILATTLIGLLAACGSDSPKEEETGLFSLGVSDNPADAKEVNIAFKQIVLKGSDGSISFDVSDNGLKMVDLLTVQGAEVAALVTGQSVPLGEYQLCIYMKNSEAYDEESSHVKTYDGGGGGLVTNSNGSCGGVGAEEADTGRLFLNKPVIIAAGNNEYVAEFNLAQGLLPPARAGVRDYWTLKPTSVQLVNNAEVGSISGAISQTVRDECEAAAGGSEFSLATYLYPEATALANMADFRTGDYQGDETAPIRSATVNAVTNDAGEIIGYEYEFGFVVTGTYSLGYTCVAQNDHPEDTDLADDTEYPFFIHVDAQDVTVTAGENTVQDF